jgi:hypothetical protein
MPASLPGCIIPENPLKKLGQLLVPLANCGDTMPTLTSMGCDVPPLCQYVIGHWVVFLKSLAFMVPTS